MKINKIPELKKTIMVFGIFFIIVGLILFFNKKTDNKIISGLIKTNKTGIISIKEKDVSQKVSTTPVVTKTPAPVSFDELNNKFGPCIKVSVLMYHHIQTEAEAKLKNQANLTITPDFFRQHLQYLKDKNYTITEPKDLINFFNGTNKLSGKLAMITMDDAYEDNYLKAYPILKEFGFKATIFSPTGLIDNLDYLKWDDMSQMKDLIYFGNHTWSHHSASGTKEVLEKEITLADKQLSEKGFNNEKIFAYPYGGSSVEAINILKENNYNLAFTTKHGNIMCKNQYLELPRIRVGNAPLSNYGL